MRPLVTQDDIETYLIEIGMPFEEVAEGIWRVDNEVDQVPNIFVSYAPPLVLFRLKVMDLKQVPPELHLDLFRRLLELNATGMALGAYALDGDSVILTEALSVEDMNLGEFRASLESISFAAKQHYRELSPFLSAPALA